MNDWEYKYKKLLITHYALKRRYELLEEKLKDLKEEVKNSGFEVEKDS